MVVNSVTRLNIFYLTSSWHHTKISLLKVTLNFAVIFAMTILAGKSLGKRRDELKAPAKQIGLLLIERVPFHFTQQVWSRNFLNAKVLDNIIHAKGHIRRNKLWRSDYLLRSRREQEAWMTELHQPWNVNFHGIAPCFLETSNSLIFLSALFLRCLR